MENISPRQMQILKALIDEYIETAEPVASETLDKKYNLGVSPATIRNEMVRLTSLGLLEQPHTSAGRIPTTIAMRYYISKIMKQKDISVAEEVLVKQKIFECRKETDKLLREATRALAKQTKAMSLTATDEGEIYASGMSNLLAMPEFYNIDMARHLFYTLDEYDYWWSVFSRLLGGGIPFSVVLGEDLRRNFLNKCGGVFIRFNSVNHQGFIGVVGPSRLNYPKIIPIVVYMGNLINDVVKDW